MGKFKIGDLVQG